MQPELTVISVYYSYQQYQTCLGPSLARQRYSNYQLLLVDNSKNTYHNMRDAVGSVSGDIHGEYVMLVHPDIAFPEIDTLEKIMCDCRKGFPEYAILGAAGQFAHPTLSFLISSVVGFGTDPIGIAPSKITPCFSLDECIVVMPISVFRAYPLADLGKTWHMYIVELCCHLRQDGKEVGVFTEKVNHYSKGTMNRSYYQAQRKVARKYRKTFPIIYTTVLVFPTSPVRLWKVITSNWLWNTVQTIKTWMLAHIPCSKYLFRISEAVFHSRREYIRSKKQTKPDMQLEILKEQHDISEANSSDSTESKPDIN